MSSSVPDFLGSNELDRDSVARKVCWVLSAPDAHRQGWAVHFVAGCRLMVVLQNMMVLHRPARQACCVCTPARWGLPRDRHCPVLLPAAKSPVPRDQAPAPNCDRHCKDAAAWCLQRRDSDDAEPSLKKPRVVWSMEMHQQFVNAVNQLGIDSESSAAFSSRCLG